MLDSPTAPSQALEHEVDQLNLTDAEQFFRGLKNLRDVLEQVLVTQKENSLKPFLEALKAKDKSIEKKRGHLETVLTQLNLASELILSIGQRNKPDEPPDEGEEGEDEPVLKIPVNQKRHPLQVLKSFLNEIVQEEREASPKKEKPPMLEQFEYMIKVQNMWLKALRECKPLQHTEVEFYWIKIMAATHCALMIRTGIATQSLNGIKTLNHDQIKEIWTALKEVSGQLNALQELFPELFSEV